MSDPPPRSYTVSCLHPDTRNFHGESCPTLEEAQQRVKDLRAAGYQSVTISPPDRNTPSWPKNWRHSEGVAWRSSNVILSRRRAIRQSGPGVTARCSRSYHWLWTVC